MQIRYKHQRFQTEAARSIANAFTGQPKSDGQSDHTIDQGKNKGLFKLAGFGNKNVVLAREAVCENVRAVQTEQGLKPVDYLQDLQALAWRSPSKWKQVQVRPIPTSRPCTS